MHRSVHKRAAFSFVELLAIVAVIGVVAAIIVTRLADGSSTSKSAACQTNQGDIEIQVELWRHNTGSAPAANLSNIGSDPQYFPSGLPVCPVTGDPYTIDGGGRVVGHNH